MDKKLPHAGLRAPIRPQRYAAPRKLSAEQLKKPFIRKALWRLSRIGELRGRYLRDLDTIHGGRRTRSEKFAALARIPEQLLVRLDLASGVLGWLDVEQGQFFLNTQCSIAEDSGISPSVLNRLLHSMEKADYVYRRIEKVRLDEKDEAGLNLVRTRVLVRFTEKFWADLGLRYEWIKAKKSAIKKRDQELRQVAMSRSARIEKASLEAFQRELKRSKWRKSEERKTVHQEPPKAPSNGVGPPTPDKPPQRPPSGPETVTSSMARLLRSVESKKTT
ncbi:hypothetical protein [Pseudomonas putida]|uniref:hypothetical protein n=1 Tax=Pseudomonas putida TaxID=303 RepID=UPI00209BDA13|nr:hypothetical protein [Pseudomonas putida]